MNSRRLPIYGTSVLYIHVATPHTQYLYGYFVRLGFRTPRKGAVSPVDRPSLDGSCSGGCHTSFVSWHLAARYMVALHGRAA